MPFAVTTVITACEYYLIIIDVNLIDKITQHFIPNSVIEMGEVLFNFENGFPGAVSRSIDNIIVSLRNATSDPIPFGAPVFLASGGKACSGFVSGTSTAEKFLGFAVRAADKTPLEYGSSRAAFEPGDPVDVLVRGSTVLHFAGFAMPGSDVYIRVADGELVTSAGASGSTLQLPNVTVRTTGDASNCAEVVVKTRNAL